VLPTRLSAVDEAATMDVLCADKTGTLTRNELKVTAVQALPDFDDAHVLALAALASSDGGQDPVDAAIRAAAGGKPVTDAPQLVELVPFDPAAKMSQATVSDLDRGTQRVLKGAFSVVVGQAHHRRPRQRQRPNSRQKASRVLAVAAGPVTAIKLVGLIALSDPPHADSTTLVTELHGLGVRTVMVTGDAPATALIVARAVGLAISASSRDLQASQQGNLDRVHDEREDRRRTQRARNGGNR
jgi:H+-transporting ATPase